MLMISAQQTQPSSTETNMNSQEGRAWIALLATMLLVRTYYNAEAFVYRKSTLSFFWHTFALCCVPVVFWDSRNPRFRRMPVSLEELFPQGETGQQGWCRREKRERSCVCAIFFVSTRPSTRLSVFVPPHQKYCIKIQEKKTGEPRGPPSPPRFGHKTHTPQHNVNAIQTTSHPPCALTRQSSVGAASSCNHVYPSIHLCLPRQDPTTIDPIDVHTTHTLRQPRTSRAFFCLHPGEFLVRSRKAKP